MAKPPLAISVRDAYLTAEGPSSWWVVPFPLGIIGGLRHKRHRGAFYPDNASFRGHRMNEASRQSTDQIVQLLTNVQQQLTRYVRTLVPNRSDAEEVLQETNLFVWRHADEFELGTNFAAWACKIAYYQVLTFRKRQSRSRLCFSDALVEQLADGAVDQPCPGERRGRSPRPVHGEAQRGRSGVLECVTSRGRPSR